MYSLVALSLFTLLCNHHHHLFPEFFSSCKNEILQPLNNKYLPIVTSLPGNHHSTFYLYEPDYLRYLTEVKSHNVGPFVTGLFHLA